MALQYRFMPWVRRGLARTYATPNDAPLEARPRVQVGLALQASRDGVAAANVENHIQMRLYGPADVIGIDPRLIVRTEPKALISNFEPNYLAAIDFDPPDFPWMFTPAKPDANKRLRPWLVLLVLDRDNAKVALPAMRGGPLPRIELTAAQAQSELPGLSESALWAHAQAASAINNADALATEMRQQPDCNISRLIAPRRLRPATRYFACVVPAFDAGRKAGLGEVVAEDVNAAIPLEPAWPDDPQQRGAISIPVYFHWEFSTGPLGDFETLARRLKTPKNYPPGTSLNDKLNKLGTAPVLLDADRVLAQGRDKKTITYEGALVSLTYQWQGAAVSDVSNRLSDIISEPNAMNLAQGPATRVPTIGPPVYGGWHAKKHVVPKSELNAKTWLADLNLDPRYRLAAGYGSEIIRQDQEQLMQSCWAQVGNVLRAEQTLNLGRFAYELGRSVFKRHFAKLPPERTLSVLSPARGRLSIATAETVLGRIAKSSLPDAVIDPALRRFTSPQRPMLKAAVRLAGKAAIATQVQQLFTAFAKASHNLGLVDPTLYVPDGILGTDIYDGIALPDNPDAPIDLGPELGLPRTMRAGDIRALREGSATLRKAGKFARPKPSLQTVRRNGLLTETHRLQFAVLQQQTQTPLTQQALGTAVTSARVRGAEGMLLSLPATGDARDLSVAPLMIDGRNGALRVISRQRGLRSLRANATLTGALGAVSTAGLKRYGTSTVFATLPANSLPAQAGTQPVVIAASGAAGFKPVGRTTAVGNIVTMTVPAPIRDDITLGRVSAAFADYTARFKGPFAAAGSNVAVKDFPLAATAAGALTKVKPDVTIPARVSSMLSVDGAQLKIVANGEFNSVFVGSTIFDLNDERLRFVIPRTFDRVMAYPRIPLPMYKPLADRMRDAFMPGAEDIPNDFVLLVGTNPRFVESFMVGLNHEMGRELLWRGYPTDQRGTPFRQFWARLDDKLDIEPIHTWNYWKDIGSQGADSAEQNTWLVLLIRGELLKRFPNTVIYAQKRSLADPRKLGTPAEFPGTTMADLIQRPIFFGTIPPDMTFVGFPIPEAERSQWCFVLEEQMTEPRFGFDEPGGSRARPQPSTQSWKDVLWSDIGIPPVIGGAHFRLADMMQANDKVAAALEVNGNSHAAVVARALLQRPFRGFWVGDDLIPQV